MAKPPKLKNPERRAVAEWVGEDPDARVPAHVRLRIFRDAGGICHLTERKIADGEAWHLEHVIPIIAGGGHRESNLRPALITPHQQKTKREAHARAKADACAKKALGIREEQRQNQKIQSPPKPAREKRDQLPVPPPRDIYERTK